MPCFWPFSMPGRSMNSARIGVTARVSGMAAICAASDLGTPGPPPVSSVWPAAWTVKSRAKLCSI